MTAAPSATWLRGSPDLVSRGRSYRVEETAREAGTSVRIAESGTRCILCGRVFKGAARGVRQADRSWLCIPHAILNGTLVPFAWTCSVPDRVTDARAGRTEA